MKNINFLNIQNKLMRLHNKEDKLTEWENNFVDSITEQMEKQARITEKQANVIDKIYKRFKP